MAGVQHYPYVLPLNVDQMLSAWTALRSMHPEYIEAVVEQGGSEAVIATFLATGRDAQLNKLIEVFGSDPRYGDRYVDVGRFKAVEVRPEAYQDLHRRLVERLPADLDVASDLPEQRDLSRQYDVIVEEIRAHGAHLTVIEAARLVDEVLAVRLSAWLHTPEGKARHLVVTAMDVASAVRRPEPLASTRFAETTAAELQHAVEHQGGDEPGDIVLLGQNILVHTEVPVSALEGASPDDLAGLIDSVLTVNGDPEISADRGVGDVDTVHFLVEASAGNWAVHEGGRLKLPVGTEVRVLSVWVDGAGVNARVRIVDQPDTGRP
jgi:hypothetical protein